MALPRQGYFGIERGVECVAVDPRMALGIRGEDDLADAVGLAARNPAPG
jgi:hypothetical protein